MFVPDQFRIEELAEMHAMMRANPFATLVTTGANGMTATHLPTVFKADDGAHGAIEAHMARPNDQWKTLDPDAEALVIFSGPQTYIHPGWYPSKAVEGKVVPTWNYAAVHAYGRVTLVHDGDWLKAHVAELTNQQENEQAEPWSVDDAPAQFIQMLTRGIVGVRIEIDRIDGKAKMSQNRDDADRRSVIDALAREPGDQPRAVADWMTRADK
jgi:transcriptional regulator